MTPKKNTRLRLHEILCDILGSRNCYYVPPSNIDMNYPCITYELEQASFLYADNKRYLNRMKYSITVIDHDPESEIVKRLFKSNLPYLSMDRSPYVIDGLHHFPMILFF